MNTKTCKKCHIIKNYCGFGKCTKCKDGILNICKSCKKIINSEYRNSNPEKYKEKQKKYRDNNKLKEKERIKIWRNENREKVNYKINQYEKNRKKTDSNYKLIRNVRVRIYQFFKKNGYRKNKRTLDILGCNYPFLKEYLESKFTDGMSWDKIGEEIHIDHIIPLSSAKNEDEVYKLCHYTNLQPLWSEDNLKKGNKILN
jgi:hypothetical protein